MKMRNLTILLLLNYSGVLLADTRQHELDKLEQIKTILEYFKQNLTLINANVSAASTDNKTSVASQAIGKAFMLSEYHNLEQIYAYLDELNRRYDHVQVSVVAKTGDQRPIKAVRVVNNASDPDLIWLDALTHAREWVTGATLLYILDSLVANYGSTAKVYSKNYIIIPVVNPDGYAQTWTNDRMWRKTRSHSPSSKCTGVDINRNYNHTFGGEGSSNDTCSEVYRGPFALSEVETRTLSSLLLSLKDRVKFYLTIHSYSQYWTCPYSYTDATSKSHTEHMRVLQAIQKAVYETGGAHYEIGPYGKLLYLASGTGLDFAYDTCGILHSYLVELRDTGSEGFKLSEAQIEPTAKETLAGLRAGLEVVFGAESDNKIVKQT